MKLYNVCFYNGEEYEDADYENYLIGAENGKQSIKIAKEVCPYSEEYLDENISSVEITKTDNDIEIIVK